MSKEIAWSGVQERGGVTTIHLDIHTTKLEVFLKTLHQLLGQSRYTFPASSIPTSEPIAPKTAAEILDGVKAILTQREGNYNHPKRNFERIADFWNDYIKNRPDPNAPLGAVDVALMMILFKVAREEFKHGEDNLLDTIGYAVCALRSAE